ncbi:hypothetical protein BGX28_005131 [Mortierella sp. GBA30]|nr:hypothetical protein BGX28_005131 [Mortierella sp. GBA30]
MHIRISSIMATTLFLALGHCLVGGLVITSANERTAGSTPQVCHTSETLACATVPDIKVSSSHDDSQVEDLDLRYGSARAEWDGSDSHWIRDEQLPMYGQHRRIRDPKAKAEQIEGCCREEKEAVMDEEEARRHEILEEMRLRMLKQIESFDER